MEKEGVTKNEMAKRMHTSRSQLDRILDPDNDKVQLDTVFKAAHALGREVKRELVLAIVTYLDQATVGT